MQVVSKRAAAEIEANHQNRNPVGLRCEAADDTLNGRIPQTAGNSLPRGKGLTDIAADGKLAQDTAARTQVPWKQG